MTTAVGPARAGDRRTRGLVGPRRWIPAFAGATLTIAAAAAIAQPTSDRARAFIETTRQTLKSPDRVAAPPSATVRIDMLDADVHEPPEAVRRGRVPVVLLVHGGIGDDLPIRPRAWQVYRDWGSTLAAHGVAAVMVEHRLGNPERRPDVAATELGAVLRWIRTEAGLRGWDAKRVTVMTFSAGALVVPELVRRDTDGTIHRIVMFYPMTDSPPGREMRLDSAFSLLASRRTPVVVVRAGADAVPGLLPLLDPQLAGALAANLDIEVLNLPRAPHAFDMTYDEPEGHRAIRHVLDLAGD